MPQTHVVFGAGQVGSTLAGQLRASGHRVVIVSRSGSTGGEAGVEAVRGDAMDAAFCTDAARTAAVVYHCMNPKYEARAWAAQLPRIQENLIAAAGRAGARLVVLDNVYSLGRTGGKPMNEDTPDNPCSRKGEIRARLAASLVAAHRRGDVRAVTGRACDFFGPRGVQTMFETRFWTRVLAGKSAQVIANPDTLHTYHYIPDVAAGLATLGGADEAALGGWWMLPAAPAVTTRDLIATFARAIGRDVAVSPVPEWLLRLLMLMVPLFREMSEMRYQWDEPFVADDRRFRSRFGSTATPLDNAARETVAWARSAFGRPS
jgi:nucleoside-diphosphate-sugar epimerase